MQQSLHIQPATGAPRFVADAHLGRLARQLRMLGFDTEYQKETTRQQLLKTAVSENRVLLTRAASVALNPFVHACIILSENVDAQLAQVVHQFALGPKLQPFSRCLVCNAPLQAVSKKAVAHLLQSQTLTHFDAFWQCPHCHHIYWKGSHYERMMERLKALGLG